MQTLAKLKSGELDGVKRLTLAEGLSEFPEEIFNLRETLEVLDLTGNSLSSLPDNFDCLKRLKILFLSNNNFEVLPSVLGRCGCLGMIGFKSNRISVVPEEALPPQTRWLILTDNCITELPDSIGSLHRLQKLMLAGNQLSRLPGSIARCENLQLLRISANQLLSFPEQLFNLPCLAWLAFAGNPFCYSDDSEAGLPEIDVDDLVIGEVLGDGASGVISRAHWREGPFTFPENVAVKLFKGGVTSDGFVQDELRATLMVGRHNNLVSPLASIPGKGLVMRLIPDGYRNLAGPPSLESCTRDVFAEGTSLRLVLIEALVEQVEAVVEHIHSMMLCHGDLYAHNMLLDESSGHVLLGDFGAASHYRAQIVYVSEGVRRIEKRALGFFIEDILSVCDIGARDSAGYRLLSLKARNYIT